MKHRAVRLARRAYRALIAAVLILGLLLTPPAALAQRKKKEEEAAPEKSYVFSYFVVMMVVGVGLMVVCRPSNRKDRVDEKKRQDEED